MSVKEYVLLDESGEILSDECFESLPAARAIAEEEVAYTGEAVAIAEVIYKPLVACIPRGNVEWKKNLTDWPEKPTKGKRSKKTKR